MEPRKDEMTPEVVQEPREQDKGKRSQIAKLEERIAPVRWHLPASAVGDLHTEN